MTDWTRAERRIDGTWTAIDCRECAHKALNMAFHPPLLVCIHPEVVGKSTDRPACEVQRRPGWGRCGPGGKLWVKKEDKK